MKYRNLRIGLPVLCLALLAIPLAIVHGAGGRIEGKVVDPKGAVVVGATVTVTDPETNKTFIHGPKKSCVPRSPVVRCAHPRRIVSRQGSLGLWQSGFFPQDKLDPTLRL